jgi:hypothetical protein
VDSADFHRLAWRWLRANAVVALALFVGALLAYPVRGLFDPADAGVGARVAILGAELFANVLPFALYARLTQPILGEILPAFPKRLWFMLHLAIGLALGTWMGLEIRPSESGDFVDLGFGLQALFAVVALLAGATVGAIFGALQALVLRSVAHGTWVWIAGSAADWSVMFLALGLAFLFGAQEETFAATATLLAVGAIASLVGAIIMLPALRRLRPRTA